MWLWLEDVHDAYRSQWPLAQYAHAARCLGRFNGAYVAGRPWPPYVWLSRTTTEPRGVIDAFGWAEALVRDPATWQHPLLRDIFAADLVARLPEFWSSRHRLLEAYERLPQTLCHQDAWRGNWIVPDIALDADMVLVDWAVAGRGVLGSDLGDLAVAEHGTLLDSISLADIDDTVFDAYLAGLREAGWPAGRNQVRFAYTTFAALKYGCLLIWLRNVLDETLRGDLERVLGRPIDGYLRQQAVLLEHLLRLHAEALSLLETR